ncbi:MAG: type II toxin-antitoxin system VapB family antitoxin [Candidatus Marinimicrobia bacterium]|nr:type II toxin-antitoxin system VapB family antitoxin [Candidatus Neomarinimicrobiota bacterium]
MRTTLDIDKTLIEEALDVTGLKTKKAVIEAGLKELIANVNVESFIDSFGSIDDYPVSTKTVRKWRELEESIIEPGSVNEPTVS